MINKLICATVALTGMVSSVAAADTLVVKPASENLTATSFEYRVDATRRLYDYGAYAMFKDLRGEEAIEAIRDREHSMFWYRFLSTFRKCEHYDLLQGTSLFDRDSWYLAAWYHQVDMTPVDGRYEAAYINDEEKACGGKLWSESTVNVQWTDPTNDATQHQGVIQIVTAKNAPSVAEVTCKLSGNPDDTYRLSCEAATVSSTAKKPTIIVHLEGLD